MEIDQEATNPNFSGTAPARKISLENAGEQVFEWPCTSLASITEGMIICVFVTSNNWELI